MKNLALDIMKSQHSRVSHLAKKNRFLRKAMGMDLSAPVKGQLFLLNISTAARALEHILTKKV